MIAEAALAAVVHLSPTCSDPTVRLLHSAGFRGRALRYAYGIVMRESKGNPRAISPRRADFGLFQFNRAAWSRADWWDERQLLDGAYSAAVAFKLSQGGRTWYPWDINGRGYHLKRYSSTSTYRVFVKYVKAYPC
jgi:hypothetical protein